MACPLAPFCVERRTHLHRARLRAGRLAAAGSTGRPRRTRCGDHLAYPVPPLRGASVTGPVIIGGGPAGSAAAIELARAGHQATLFERTVTDTDKVCGDFLSAEAITRIETLGIGLAAAPPIDTLRLIHRRRVVQTKLPFIARGLSRRALDEALLRKATAAGVTVLRGHRVSTVEDRGAGLQVVSTSLGQIGTTTVFLAT